MESPTYQVKVDNPCFVLVPDGGAAGEVCGLVGLVGLRGLVRLAPVHAVAEALQVGGRRRSREVAIGLRNSTWKKNDKLIGKS